MLNHIDFITIVGTNSDLFTIDEDGGGVVLSTIDPFDPSKLTPGVIIDITVKVRIYIYNP